MTAIVPPASPTATPGAQPSPQGAKDGLVGMPSFENVLAQIGGEVASLAGGQSVPLPLPAKPAVPTDPTTEAMVAAIAAMLPPVASPAVSPPQPGDEGGDIAGPAANSVSDTAPAETARVFPVSTSATPPVIEAKPASVPSSADGPLRPSYSQVSAPASAGSQQTPSPIQEIALLEKPSAALPSGAVEVQNTAPTARLEITGTSAAKAGVGMPHSTNQHLPKSAPAISARPVLGAAEDAPQLPLAPPQSANRGGRESVPSSPVSAVSSGNAHVLSSAPTNSSRSHEEPPRGGEHRTADSLALSQALPMEVPARPEPTMPMSRPEIIHIVERTVEAATRLRASGSEQVEVAVRLDGGHELTIRLQLANGEVTPVIRTHSDALKQALEQNWSQFTERGGDRGVRMAAPVFESSQTPSNMTDLNHQRDGRQRPSPEPPAEYLPPRRARPSHKTAASQDAVQLYA